MDMIRYCFAEQIFHAAGGKKSSSIFIAVDSLGLHSRKTRFYFATLNKIKKRVCNFHKCWEFSN
uniref:Uncharacterized protein n=1 Tax=Helianthus annuus TaxID=4232 RepID=A0A251SAH7_HELAN